MGLTFDKILVILVIAMFVVGPDRLPVYAKKLGELVRSIKRMSEGAKDRLKEEMGPEYDEVDWRQLDPRQYDPRRIIRDALLEDERETRVAERRAARSTGVAAAGAVVAGAAVSDTDSSAPVGLAYDEEAT
ncbi:translocase [Leucobacter viscericola]|uniref:Translocase n=1 Tax=Leucobacter viscericola TaxID=2714935 RepID=A0A6G7XJX5_9MICO|nr:twin-arginine translocase TatA/TatE family subunit [Leucobacter viscericola]QIK64678.1 translocase [Leucobacter viscericola]